MKPLLDNHVPKRARRLFQGQDVKHASDEGFETLSNGDLMRAAALVGYDALITVDRKIRHEHRLDRVPLPVVLFDTRDTRFPPITAMSQHFEAALAATKICRFVILDQQGGFTLLAKRS